MRIQKLALLIFCILRQALAEEEPRLPPGLRAELFANGDLAGDPLAGRVDPDLEFDWGEAPPDLRLEPGPFSMRWRGRLFVPGDGAYRFFFHLAGAAGLRLEGRTLLEGSAPAAAWIEGQTVQLEYGYHRLEVEFRKIAPQARLGLYWRSEEFGLEPVGESYFFQPEGSNASQDFERGLRLARALRCAACHEIPGLPRPAKAPSLARAGAALQRRYAIERLLSPAQAFPGSRMPELSLSREEAEAAADYLGIDSTGASRGKTASPAPEKLSAAGRRLVLSCGCLACHTWQGIGLGERFSGGALERAGEHRTTAALEAWLAPGAGPEDATVHRPELPLAAEERKKIAAFLSGASDPPEASGEPAGSGDAAAGNIARGRDIARSRRCAACHELPEEFAAAPAPPLHRAAPRRPERSCLSKSAAPAPRPYFPLEETERRAVEEFLNQVAPAAKPSPFEEGRLLLQEKHCTSCHSRGNGPGIAQVLIPLAGRFPEWRGLEGTLRPPSLSAAGDKLLDPVLLAALRGEAPVRRPWLEVRMPRFRHLPEEERALLEFLKSHDRLPEPPENPGGLPPAGELFAAGHALCGSSGFGCASCHDLGKYSPPGVLPSVRGPDLLKFEERLRRPWFFRWLRDPGRMVPGIEMPAIVQGLPDLLGGRLDHQLAALWHAFNAEGFSVPESTGAIREIAAAAGGPARAIRDVFHRPRPFGEGWTPNAFGVGLPGGHSLLYDFTVFSPVAWWTGGFARQLAQGKSWLWEPAGVPALPQIPAFPSIALRRGVELLLPEWTGQTRGALESWERAGSRAMKFSYRLRFRDGARLEVREILEAPSAVPDTVIRRLAVRSDGPAPPAVFLLPILERNAPRLSADGVAAQSERGNISIAAEPEAAWRRLEPLADLPSAAALFEHPLIARGDALEIEVAYRLPGPPEPIAASPPFLTTPAAAAAAEKSALEELEVAPGFTATRLPLETSIMPTAFAFSEKGEVFFASLKGDLFKLLDEDGDGCEETCRPAASLLSAPFGLLAEGGDLLVSTKPELLRLSDADGDGFFERGRVEATGWGFSDNYHDWTFGIVQREGSYYLLLGSDYQQTGRPPAAAWLRGKAVRASPQGELEKIARGLRFTAGIARNAAGEIFFTDNQGDRNTFNEINHLEKGKAYGVPSLYDPPEDSRAEGEPPAIKVPHPWTRSVNGLCFLEAGGRFGPYEGHGLACEYDNRMLIRFSLQKIGAGYQGACYPFSQPPKGGRWLLGPLSAGVHPSGEVYIGGLRDSGWGGGNNTGEIVRLGPQGNFPFGIREMRAWKRGFEIELTGPCDRKKAADPESYTLSAYRRFWKGEYSTPDQDRHRPRITQIDISEAGRKIRLQVSPFQRGFVHEIHLRPLGPAEEPLWPASAYYTLNAIPEEER